MHLRFASTLPGVTEKRRYQLQCPIARALDVVGDRWALLVLRDLHAGPARFGELETGLGIATNLLSARLADLTAAGLVDKTEGTAHGAYSLTDLGRRTDRILWELSRFGGLVGREPDPRTPGNLRTVALPLRIMLESVVERPELTAQVCIDGEPFTIHSSPTDLDVVYGTDAPQADVEIHTTYEAVLDVSEGLLSPEEFAEQHVELVVGADRVGELLALLGAGLAAVR